MPAPGSRSYHSPKRDRQRANTKAGVIAAAEHCFLEHGYATSSIVAVAAAADVSPETVYGIFGSKRALLQAVVETAVTGNPEDANLLRDELIARIRAEPDQRRRFEVIVAATEHLLERTTKIDAMVRGAAATDPHIAEMEREHDRRTRRDVRRLVSLLAEAGPLRMSEDDAADVMWALARQSGFYRALTADRRWSHRRASSALSDVLRRVLFVDV
jgi:TetR/AcrR family transcriptional regulator, regulator of autoinduction and epiphytic fitness